MKRVKNLAFLIASLLLTIALWAGITPPVCISAEAAGEYDFTIADYQVEMDVKQDRTIDVKEVIKVRLEGRYSHGIIRDFALDGGVRYRSIKASCDNEDFYWDTEIDSNDFLSLYLRGEKIATGQYRTYTLTYTLIVPPVWGESGMLPLDVIGYGWQADIVSATGKITLPTDLERGDIQLYVGREDGTVRHSFDLSERVISFTASNLREGYGATLNLQFADGFLTTEFDMGIVLAILVAIATVGMVFILKLVTRRPTLAPTVNLKAPEQMDPLRMGKLIDNNVDSEDFGALIFYLADKGYLHLNLTNEDDPVISKTTKNLPDDAPMAQRLLYNGLFQGRDIVAMSEIKDTFYVTADAVKKNVVGVQGGMYSPKSKTLMAIGCAFSVLIPGLFVALYGALTIINAVLFTSMIFGCVFAVLTSVVTSSLVVMRQYKWKEKTKKLVQILGVIGGIVIGTIIWAILPYSFLPMNIFGGLFLITAASVGGMMAGSLISRTEQYNEVLGHVVGFKNFILYTEKDRIEMMFKDEPQLFFHILPYAQVLGVTDEWTDKFKGLRIDMPAYMTTNTAADVIVYTSVYRSVSRTMAYSMISRPSAKGSSGRIGGGFGGGGFGGGGGRGC